MINRLRRRLHRDERGVSAVEFGLMAPLLVLLLAGMTDLGLMLRSSRTATDALHSAARQGARAGDQTLADMAILRAVQARMEGESAVEAIVIYRATGDGSLPAACRPTGPVAAGGVPDTCNIYPGSLLAAPLLTTDFDDGTCTTGEPDDYWCPDGRAAAYTAGDRLGVWMAYTFEPPLGLVVPTQSLERQAVFRLEINP